MIIGGEDCIPEWLVIGTLEEVDYGEVDGALFVCLEVDTEHVLFITGDGDEEDPFVDVVVPESVGLDF